jgi:hypothetical protein
MPTGAEMCGDQTIRGQEALRVSRGLASVHAPFPLPRGLLRILGAVLAGVGLAVFPARQARPLGRPRACQLVGNDHAGHVR